MRRSQMRRVFARLEPLLPDPWDEDKFAERLANRRKRPIRIVVADLGARDGIGGATISTSRADYVCVSETAVGLRRLAIVLHELAHIALEHVDSDQSDHTVDGARTPLDATRPSHDYGTEQELDAETLATLLSAEIRHRAERAGRRSSRKAS